MHPSPEGRVADLTHSPAWPGCSGSCEHCGEARRTALWGGANRIKSFVARGDERALTTHRRGLTLQRSRPSLGLRERLHLLRERSDPGSKRPDSSGVDTNATTSATHPPTRSRRASCSPTVGSGPTARHRFWCHGDLTSFSTPSRASTVSRRTATAQEPNR